jgi:hypothetical protein
VGETPSSGPGSTPEHEPADGAGSPSAGSASAGGATSAGSAARPEAAISTGRSDGSWPIPASA